AILDNLNTHHADDVLLFCVRHPRSRVRLPAHIRRLPEPDRAVVEGAALAGAQGAALRDLGGGGRGGAGGDRLLEHPPASLRVGPTTPTPSGTQSGDRRRARGGVRATPTGATTGALRASRQVRPWMHGELVPDRRDQPDQPDQPDEGGRAADDR